MKKIIKHTFGIYIMSFALTGCLQEQADVQKVNLGNENNFIVIADTLIDDAIIKNPDNDEWIDYSLRNLNKKILVDNIFESVYAGKLIPYDFFNETPLTISDIKALEESPEFSRDNIAKVQFEEAWFYDSQNQKMIKKVHSIMLAYEIYNSVGEIKGYKPAFKVNF